MAKIAFFDFDGTITKKDSLLEFIRFTHGNTGFVAGFALNAPWIILFKTGLVSHQIAKEKIIRFFYGGMHYENFQTSCNEFAQKVIPGMLRPGALEEMLHLQHQGYEVVIVSASPRNWIEPWAGNYNFKTITTELELNNNQLTGRIKGKNCRGQEKPERIKKVYCLADYEIIKAFGDTRDDLPMLALAHESYFKPFR